MPKKAPEKIGSVLRVPLSQLHPHPQNPFAVRDDPAMQELKESVSRNGVLVPAIARPRAEGGYELIAGHRRKHACEQAGQDCRAQIPMWRFWLFLLLIHNSVEPKVKRYGYEDSLSGVSTRNREPLQSIRPAFFSLLISADMALRSTPR